MVEQTYKNLEIILVDDGSPDNCPKMCDEWARKDSRIKVVHKENGGLSDARNAGLAIAKGEYIGFVDSDDYIDVTMYEKLIDKATESNADMTMCKFIEFDDLGNFRKTNETNLTKCDISNIAKFYVNANAIIKNGVLCTDRIMPNVWRILYKKEFIGNDKFKFGAFAEDFLFNLVQIKKQPQISIVDDYLYYYYQRATSIMHTFDRTKYEKKLDFDKSAVELLKDLVDEDSLSAYKFHSYYYRIIDFTKNNDKNLFKEFKKEKWIQEYNCRKNYKCAQKLAKSFKTKIAYWLVYKKLFNLFKLAYQLKEKYL